MALVDILILTALQDELEAVLGLGEGWAERRDSQNFRYYERGFPSDRGEELRVAAAWVGEMGAEAAAIRGGKLLDELDPACLAMCGVCAGDRAKVRLGDVIVADQLWPWDEGKSKEGEFFHAARTFDLQATWKMDAAHLARELHLEALSCERPPTKDAQRRWFLHALFAHEGEGKPAPAEHPERKSGCPSFPEIARELLEKQLVVRQGRAFRLTDAGRDAVDEDLALHPDGFPKDPPIRVHVGAIASGSALIEDEKIFERLRKIVRTTIGLEMEGSAIGQLARRFEKKAILVKAVQDYADREKDDAFRGFACKASAVFLMAFLQRHFEPQRKAPEPAEVGPRRERGRDFEMEREDPFLARVERVARLRHAGAGFTRHRGPAPFAGVLEVAVDVGGFFDMRVVAALDGPITEALAMRFVDEVEPHFRARHSMLRTTLVHRGEVAPKELRERMHRRGVLLETFDQYQGLFDLTAYLDWQTRELERSTVYAPGVYVEQHATIEIAGNLERVRTEDILRSLWDLLATPSQRRFVLVLGEFGAGKTFLLRELCRRMGRDKHPVWPVLLEMSKLEKQHDLAELLGAHFGRADVPGYNFKAFQYMLEEGRIALFFDGFDELADRVTYDTATAHFDTVLSAAQGQAKVLLSSRRQHFLTDGDADRAVRRELAKKAEGVAGAGYRLVMIEPFGERQIKEYLRKRLDDAEAAEARYRLIDEVKDLLGLSHNPRMLAFIAGIPEESLREAKKEHGEISAAGLYELLVRHWLDFEHQRSRRMGSSKGIARAALDRGIEVLGISMWHERARTVGVERIREVLERSSGMLGEHSLDPGALTFVFGSGSLLVRDAEGQFAFVHRSVMEWLVARVSAEELLQGKEPAALAADEMSALMADFFVSMAGREKAAGWARARMGEEGIVQKNAALLFKRMGERFELVSFEGQDLRGKDFSGVDWRGANLRKADLRGATLVRANLGGASLVNANLSRADMRGAAMIRAEIRNADFSFAKLQGASVTMPEPLDSWKWRGANLLGAEGVPDEMVTRLVGAGAVPPVLRSVDPMLAGAASCHHVAWSPDGELLAAAQRDGTIWLVDTVAGQVLRLLSGFVHAVNGVAFCPDGKTLASASDDGAVRLWDVCTGRELRTLEGHTNPVTSVAWSPDGKKLASASIDKNIRLWDAATGRNLGVFEGHTDGVTSVAWSPDGERLASGSDDNTVRLWDVGTGAMLAQIDAHFRTVASVAWSPDGKLLASGSYDNAIRLWDVASRSFLRGFMGHSSPVTSVAWSPDGKVLASASDDKTVRLWDVASGRALRTFEVHTNWVTSVAFSPDGKTLASGSYDKTVCLWDIGSGSFLRVFDGYTNGVSSAAWSPNGASLVSVSDDATLRLWDVRSGRAMEPLKEGHWRWVSSVAWSPDGKSLALGYGKHVRIWDLQGGRVQRMLEAHTKKVTSVAWSPDGQSVVSASDDNTIRFWHVATARVLATFAIDSFSVLGIAWSPDGKLLACGSYDGIIRILHAGSWQVLSIFEGHGASVRGVSWSPDGKTLASGSDDKTVKLWHVESGRMIGTFEVHTDAVTSVAWSPDGKSLSTSSADNTIRLWDLATGRCLAILLATPTGWVAFTPDGRYKYGGNITGSFWHIAGLCRFEPGELDLLLPDDADFFNLPEPPTEIKPCPPTTKPPSP